MPWLDITDSQSHQKTWTLTSRNRNSAAGLNKVVSVSLSGALVRNAESRIKFSQDRQANETKLYSQSIVPARSMRIDKLCREQRNSADRLFMDFKYTRPGSDEQIKALSTFQHLISCWAQFLALEAQNPSFLLEQQMCRSDSE